MPVELFSSGDIRTAGPHKTAVPFPRVIYRCWISRTKEVPCESVFFR